MQIQQQLVHIPQAMATALKRSGEPVATPVSKKLATMAAPKVVQEPDVGITQYINRSTVGFVGEIKLRYSDFQVFELDQDGRVVHLTDQGPVLGATSKEKRQEKRRKALENRDAFNPERQQALQEEESGDKPAGGVNGYNEGASEGANEGAIEGAIEAANEGPSEANGSGERSNESEKTKEANGEPNGTYGGGVASEELRQTSEGIQGSSLGGNEPESQVKVSEASESPTGIASNEIVNEFQLTDEYRTKLSQYLTAEEIDEMQKLVVGGGSMQTSTQFHDKATRTLLHQLFRQAFDGKLDTSTTADNTFKIGVSSSKPARKNNYVNHVDESGIVNYGLGPYKNYLHFTVYKENRETMEVANTITKFMRIPAKTVKYSGTKDRRGVTCQRFCIHKAKVARVTSLNKALKGTVLGLFAYSDRGLDLGDLEGNEFVIAIRNARVVGSGAETDANAAGLAAVVQESFSSLQSTGFINYYGLQRFGTFSVSSHVLGIYLLREDWKGAVELILAEQERVVPDSVNARRIWAETGNAGEALKHMPRRCLAEHSVLTLLAKNKPTDAYTTDMYFRAILNIPRNLRLIYVHAYQSYIWNLVTSKRVELFGLDVQEGDLVYAEENGEATAGDFPEDTAIEGAAKVRALTAQDVRSGNFTIYDVVLPSPGCDVRYPANEQLMQVYESAMKKDSLDPHNMGRKIKEFSLAGSYRHLVARARDVSYQITHYKEDDDSILYTDLELLEKRGNEILDEKPELGKGTEFGSGLLERIIPAPEGAEKTAVILRMKLGVSSYATMALREFMRADTVLPETSQE